MLRLKRDITFVYQNRNSYRHRHIQVLITLKTHSYHKKSDNLFGYIINKVTFFISNKNNIYFILYHYLYLYII